MIIVCSETDKRTDDVVPRARRFPVGVSMVFAVLVALWTCIIFGLAERE